MSPTERLLIEKLDALAGRLTSIELRMARQEGWRRGLLAVVGAGGGGVAALGQYLLGLIPS